MGIVELAPNRPAGSAGARDPAVPTNDEE